MKSAGLPSVVRQAHHERYFPPVRPELVEGRRAPFFAGALGLVAAIAIAGCAGGYTNVRAIKTAPDGFMNREVRLQGVASRTGEPGRADAYLLRDGSGEIMVMTKRELPAQDAEVAVKGIVRSVVSRGAQWSLELRVEETERLR